MAEIFFFFLSLPAQIFNAKIYNAQIFVGLSGQIFFFCGKHNGNIRKLQGVKETWCFHGILIKPLWDLWKGRNPDWLVFDEAVKTILPTYLFTFELN